MSEMREKGRQVGEALALIDFSVSERNYEALVRLPATLFAEYKPDPERMYDRGEVIRVGNTDKYLLTNQGRIDVDKPPPENPLCRLFRDNRRYEWVREEYCSNGFERHYTDPSDAKRTGCYKVIANNAGDNNTPPPNLPQTWQKLDK